jgi:tetratricopeptide (TPR) repeat protein
MINENINVDSLRELTENVYELSTLARVLFTNYQIWESQRIYELNVKLYPEELASNFYLAMFWKRTGNYKAAFSFIEKCYEIAPENKVVVTEFEFLKSRI